jgi:NhaP-type Na+/H+ or K+/H+ antiporter
LSATTHGAGCGVVLGIVLTVLAQQFGFLELSNLSSVLLYLIVGIIIGAVLGGLVGYLLGRRVRAREAAAATRAPDAGAA